VTTTLSSLAWRGVGSSSKLILFSILPTFVFYPTATTTAMPWPSTQIVFLKMKGQLTYANSVKTAFLTGSDSPVKSLSSNSNSLAWIKIQSTVAVLPALIWTISPTLRSYASIV
jgi:hypothetical protein